VRRRWNGCRRIVERQGWLNRERTFEDMLDELEEKGVLKRDKDDGVRDHSCRRQGRCGNPCSRAVFKGWGKGLRGNHNTGKLGRGGERQAETRPYAFGDESLGPGLQRHPEEQPEAGRGRGGRRFRVETACPRRVFRKRTSKSMSGSSSQAVRPC